MDSTTEPETLTKQPYSSESDLVIGGLSTNIGYSSEYEPLITHIWDEITLCFRKPTRLPQWQNLFRPFTKQSGTIWFCSLLCILAVVVLIFIFSELESRHIDFLKLATYSFGFMLSVSVPFGKYCCRGIPRVLMAYIFVDIFFVISIYNALFFGILVNPRYYPEIRTLDEALALNYVFVGSLETLVS